MKVLLLNQCFYPDVMATAQQLTDLALGLKAEGHEVTVITSDRGYDDPTKRFARKETWKGIDIVRIPSLAIGKGARWRRAANFASFLFACSLRLLVSRQFDAVVALTSPPLISFLGALFTRIRGGRFYFWVMDLNPDEAIAAGWLTEGSFTARLLGSFLNYSLRHANGIVALDHFMKARIVAKGVPDDLVTVLPPWAHDVRFDQEGRDAFRREYQLEDRFVVMYAGNHSPCHPLDTLLAAARNLSTDQRIVFCFVGGGSEQGKVREFAATHRLYNVRCLPYRPFSQLSGSLSAADLHVVVMGEDFVGIVHPSKVYNIVQVGCPFLYIGPNQSHITELAARLNGNHQTYLAAHGDVEAVVEQIRFAANLKWTTPVAANEIAASCSRQSLLPRLIKLLTSDGLTDNKLSPSTTAVEVR